MAANGHRPGRGPAAPQTAAPGGQDYGERYRWVALANTTAAMFMATLDMVELSVNTLDARLPAPA
jgi:hypothetical protein